MTQQTDSTTASEMDSDLLRSYLRGDDLAFETLVKRHQGMVLGVCRRVTENAEYSEDAAQASFLLLASRAKKLQTHASIAGWLHRTAVNVARTAQRSASRRKHREALAMSEIEECSAEDHREEFLELIDNALVKLPEQDRECLVLHYVEGVSRTKLASRLNLNDSTLSMRLTRAKDRLRKQLRKLGLPLTTGAMLLLLATPLNASASSVFTTVVTGAANQLHTSSIASLTGTSPDVVSLTKGVIKTMFMKKAAIVSTAACLIGSVCYTVNAGKPSTAPNPDTVMTEAEKPAVEEKQEPTRKDAGKDMFGGKKPAKDENTADEGGRTTTTVENNIVMKVEVLNGQTKVDMKSTDGNGTIKQTKVIQFQVDDADLDIDNIIRTVLVDGRGNVDAFGGTVRNGARKRQDDFFAKWDINGDGNLDDNERKAIQRSKAEEEFQKLDTDKNNVISKEEFLAAKLRRTEALTKLRMWDMGRITREWNNRQRQNRDNDGDQATIERFDENGDGVVDDAEKLKAATAILERMEQKGLSEKWKAFDANGDGILKGAERDAILKDLTGRLGTKTQTK